MATIKELLEQADSASTNLIDKGEEVVTDKTGKSIEELKTTVKEGGEDITEAVVDSLLTQGKSIPDSAIAGAAFAYALVDGWSLNVLSAILKRTPLGDDIESSKRIIQI